MVHFVSRAQYTSTIVPGIENLVSSINTNPNPDPYAGPTRARNGSKTRLRRFRFVLLINRTVDHKIPPDTNNNGELNIPGNKKYLLLEDLS